MPNRGQPSAPEASDSEASTAAGSSGAKPYERLSEETDAIAPVRATTSLGEPLVDAETVARFLAVDVATVYRLARRATLPAIQVAPRVVRFRPDDVRAYLDVRTRKAAPSGRVKRLLGSVS